MCVKLPLGDLNPDPCPLHSTSIYTCGVSIAPKVCINAYHVLLIILVTNASIERKFSKLIVLTILRHSPIEEWEGYDDIEELNFGMVWLCCDTDIGQRSSFGGLREWLGFYVFDCSLLSCFVG